MKLQVSRKSWKPVLLLLVFSHLFIIFNYLKNQEKVSDTVKIGPTVEKFAPTFSDFRWCPAEYREKIDINCEMIFDGDQNETIKAKQWSSPCSFTDEEMMKETRNCSILKSNFPFYSEMYRIPKETVDYSLAFVVIGAKNAEQMVRLMQSLYNDRNLYCITYDNKSSEHFKQTLRNLQSCYDNILMPETYYDIYWAGYSILQAAMECLKVLADHPRQWRYVQMLSWNDFPLRTNEEFVKISKIFNGSQDSYLSDSPPKRSRRYHNVKTQSRHQREHLIPEKKGKPKNIPPGNLLEFKGSLATTMSREFVEFQFKNEISKKLYVWLNSSYCAEEIYWSTLIHNLHINTPGGFPGACLFNYAIQEPEFIYVSRYQVWVWDNSCNGKLTYHSCVYGVGDLPQLSSRPELVAHKFYLDFEPATYYCLAQSHFNRTFFPEEFVDLNSTVYENLPAVRYHRAKNKDDFKCI